MRLVNLVLAAIWLGVGLAVLLGPWENPQRFTILDTGISAGWLALLLALYNLVRWWASRQYAAQQRRLAEAAYRQRSQPRRREESPRDPDPTFDFDAPPDRGPDQAQR